MKRTPGVAFITLAAGYYRVALSHEQLKARMRDGSGREWIDLPVIHDRPNEMCVAEVSFRRRDIIRHGEATMKDEDGDMAMDEAVAIAEAVLANPEWFR